MSSTKARCVLSNRGDSFSNTAALWFIPAAADLLCARGSARIRHQLYNRDESRAHTMLLRQYTDAAARNRESQRAKFPLAWIFGRIGQMNTTIINRHTRGCSAAYVRDCFVAVWPMHQRCSMQPNQTHSFFNVPSAFSSVSPQIWKRERECRVKGTKMRSLILISDYFIVIFFAAFCNCDKRTHWWYHGISIEVPLFPLFTVMEWGCISLFGRICYALIIKRVAFCSFQTSYTRFQRKCADKYFIYVL